MANFDFDQAEGLRRMLAGPKPRIVTFLSATPEDDKGAMLVNLGASLARAGNDVLIVDACQRDYGVAQRLGVDARRRPAAGGAPGVRPERSDPPGAARLRRCQHGARHARGARAADEARRLAKAFDVLVKQTGIVIVDGEFGADDSFPVPIMDSAEIVVQVVTSAASITAAYSLIKRLSQQLGRRPFGILVTGASEAEAKVVYDNMCICGKPLPGGQADLDGLGAGRRIPAARRAPGPRRGRCVSAGGRLGRVSPPGRALCPVGHAAAGARGNTRFGS